MFNFYQNFNKSNHPEKYRQEPERDVTTGHDRFCQMRPGSRKKRRNAINRRTQSAIELDSESMVGARGILRRGRSASIEEEESEEEKGYQFTTKIDSLAKILFNRVSIARGKDQNEVRNGRHQYTALGSTSICEEEGECMEMEKSALTICQDYIKKSSRYKLLKQLNTVGSRVNKHWFMVRDTALKTDRLLTLTPLTRNCSLSISPSTKDILNNLFLALQHPYILPVLDLDFINYDDQNYVILIQPINQGSLKDLIYGIERNFWNDDWNQKYAARGKGLTLPQIQQMGRQVLEALIFLKERGVPTVTHLHSGNVIVQNGVARLSGLENTLLGFTSRIYPIVTSRLSASHSVDIICFGHMLFEMCAGYELTTFKPTMENLNDIDKYPQVIELLETIFEHPPPGRLYLEDLLIHDLFRNLDLREMRSAQVSIFRPALTPSIMSLLDGIKRHNASKRTASLTSEDVVSLKSSESTTSKENSLVEEVCKELPNTAV